MGGLSALVGPSASRDGQVVYGTLSTAHINNLGLSTETRVSTLGLQRATLASCAEPRWRPVGSGPFGAPREGYSHYI